MRLRIFWRVILAQSAMILLVLAISLYTLDKLNWLIRLNGSIVTIDAVCLKEERRLLKTFLAEMRNGEKLLLTQDQALFGAYLQGRQDFADGLTKITLLVDTELEKNLTAEIKDLHVRYDQELKRVAPGKSSGEQARKVIADGLLDRANELIRLREETIDGKTVRAHELAESAARDMGWLTIGGIGGALLLAFLHARGISRPLKNLAREMRRVGQGEFTRSIDLKAPREVLELARTFNWMTEQLAQLDELKTDFTAHVSHELRTPLTAIREGTALLLEEIPGRLSSSQKEILEVVRGNSERLFLSISSILDLSKMEAQMMEYEFAPCDLQSLVEKCIQGQGPVARKKNIRVETAWTEHLPLLMLDEARMQQVVDNLLSNALKFTLEGGRVLISACIATDGRNAGSVVEVRVSNTGEGIAQEDIEKIFGRFYQGRYRGGKQHQGTGLGLAIARHIITAHEGQIRAESEPGSGATIVFTLPANSAYNRPSA
jgi:two-component system, NtrC family, sensor histidine kinase GlrK